MGEEAKGRRPLETGGVLLGYRVSQTEAVVTGAIGPGPSAIHRADGFSPDAAYQETELAARFESSDGRETYLGDWHSHPGSAPLPSRKDRRTLKRIAREPDAYCPTPIMLIAGDEADRWIIEGWQGRVGRLGRLSVRPVVLRLFDSSHGARATDG